MSVTFRAVKEDDRAQIEEWIKSDRVHAGVANADLLLYGSSSVSVYAVEDDKGTVMYVRQTADGDRCIMDIQFCPNPKRSLSALKAGFPVVKADAKHRGFSEIVFSTVSPALMRAVQELDFSCECKAVL